MSFICNALFNDCMVPENCGQSHLSISHGEPSSYSFDYLESRSKIALFLTLISSAKANRSLLAQNQLSTVDRQRLHFFCVSYYIQTLPAIFRNCAVVFKSALQMKDITSLKIIIHIKIIFILWFLHFFFSLRQRPNVGGQIQSHVTSVPRVIQK